MMANLPTPIKAGLDLEDPKGDGVVPRPFRVVRLSPPCTGSSHSTSRSSESPRNFTSTLHDEQDFAESRPHVWDQVLCVCDLTEFPQMLPAVPTNHEAQKLQVIPSLL